MITYFVKKIIKEKEDIGKDEVLYEINGKLNHIKVEMTFIILGNLVMIIFIPLLFGWNIYTQSSISFIIVMTFIYSIIEFPYKELIDFIFVYWFNLEKFLYQKIYQEVRTKVDDEFSNLSSFKKNMLITYGKSRSNLAHTITIRAMFYVKSTILYFVFLISTVFITYTIARSFLLNEKMNMTIIDFLIYPSILIGQQNYMFMVVVILIASFLFKKVMKFRVSRHL